MKNIFSFLLIVILYLNANAQTRIILEKNNRVYLIPCQVNGLNMRFIFDSVASDVKISLVEALFMLKNKYLSEDKIIGTQSYRLANGEIQEGAKIILDSINIGGYLINNVEASIVYKLNAPLLLGQSALSKLGKFSFDYSTNSLIIGNGDSNKKITVGCVSGNCINGYGTFIFSDGSKYVGEWKDDKCDGKGTYTSLDGEKYVGEFKENMRNGKGTCTYQDGSKYVGEWKGGKYDGQGTYIFPSGEKYVGEFKDNMRNGKGTIKYPNSEKYVGEFKDDMKNGKGTVTYPDGSKYIGEYKDGKYDGKGTYTFPNGRKYVGEFKDYNRNGQGTQTFQDGSKYVGEWMDDLPNGQGTYTFPDGETIVGFFRDGEYVGKK